MQSFFQIFYRIIGVTRGTLHYVGARQKGKEKDRRGRLTIGVDPPQTRDKALLD